MKPYNPFLVYGYNSPEYFCDREKETDKMISALLNERNLTLISPRRMGKTGLIKNVFYQMKRENNPNAAYFYMDIYSTRDLKAFILYNAEEAQECYNYSFHKILPIRVLNHILIFYYFRIRNRIEITFIVPLYIEHSLRNVGRGSL